MASHNSTLMPSLTPQSSHHINMMGVRMVGSGGSGPQSGNMFSQPQTPGMQQQNSASHTSGFLYNGNFPGMNESFLTTTNTSTSLQYKVPSSNNSFATLSNPTNDTIINGSKLLEKLHSKADQMKAWSEIIKLVKQCLQDRRPIFTDANERLQLQRCLDTLQNKIEVKSLHSMVERLDNICRQLKLKFNFTKNGVCFVSSDMFYVEIKLDLSTGHVLDCKVSHCQTNESLSCPALIEVLQNGNFNEFTKHLEGLSAIYQIDSDKKLKARAFTSLHALENDLIGLAEIQKCHLNDINNLIHKSPVGVLEPRKGGFPMKLTFFVPPYDLIDLQTKSTLPLTVETIKERKLGCAATVCIEESSVQHKLQIERLVQMVTNEGKSYPQIKQNTLQNSVLLPASFVLKLTQPLPICLEQAQKIFQKTSIELADMSQHSNLITLITNQHLIGKKLSHDSHSFYTKLPDQNHCYFVNGDSDKLRGILIEKIPFSHPSHVSKVIFLLREQVLFNVIISSVIRQRHQFERNCLFFEISTYGLSNIYIQFEHPAEPTLATMNIDLRDVTNVKCKLHPSTLSNMCSEEYASKIMQKSLSIPVTMRAIINRVKEVANEAKESQKKDSTTSAILNLPLQRNITANARNDNSYSGTAVSSTMARSNVLNRSNSTITPSAEIMNSSKQSISTGNSQVQQHSQYSQCEDKSSASNVQQAQPQVKLSGKSVATTTTTSSNNKMLMSMLSDTPHAAQQASSSPVTKAKKRKRVSSANDSMVPLIKQEPINIDSGIEKLNEQVTSSSFISENNHTRETSYISTSSATKTTSDDGHNEQLKIIKSLEELSKDSSTSHSDSSKIKNEKGVNSIKISKSQDQMTNRKERKRKRTDSFDARGSKDSSSNCSGPLNSVTSSGPTHLDLASSSTKPVSLLSPTTNSGQSRLLSGQNASLGPPAKLKKSNSTVGSSPGGNGGNGSTVTSPATSPSSGAKNALSHKYSDKLSNMLSSKSPKSGAAGQLSILSGSKILDFEQAAAAAVAASSGGSHAVAAAAAANALNNIDKRFGKQNKSKASAGTVSSGPKSVGGGGGSVSPTMSVSGINSAVSRMKELKQQQQQSFHGHSALVASLKQKNTSAISSSISTSSLLTGSTLTSPKQMIGSQSSQQQQQMANSMLTASLKCAVGKGKVKTSLTAVVDRLRQNADGVSTTSAPTGSSLAALAAVGAFSPNITTSESTSVRTDASHPQQNLSRTSTSSSSIKMANSDSKQKYSRNHEFVLKQGTSALKMSFSKRTPTSSSSSPSPSVTEIMSQISPGTAGLFKSSTKYTIPKIPKTSQTSSTPNITTSSTVTSPSLSLSSSASSSSQPLVKKSNATKTNLSLGNSPAKTASSRIVVKSGGQQSKARSVEKSYTKPDLTPPGGFTKLGQPFPPGPLRTNLLKSSSPSSFPTSAATPSTSVHSSLVTPCWSTQVPVTSSEVNDSKSMSTLTSNYDLYKPVFDELHNSQNTTQANTSSDNKSLQTSTPSSPVESPSMSGDLDRNQPPPPLIIPTEAVEEQASYNVSSVISTPLVNAVSNVTPPSPSIQMDSNLVSGHSANVADSTRISSIQSSSIESTSSNTAAVLDSLEKTSPRRKNSEISISEQSSSTNGKSPASSNIEPNNGLFAMPAPVSSTSTSSSPVNITALSGNDTANMTQMSPSSSSLPSCGSSQVSVSSSMDSSMDNEGCNLPSTTPVLSVSNSQPDNQNADSTLIGSTELT